MQKLNNDFQLFESHYLLKIETINNKHFCESKLQFILTPKSQVRPKFFQSYDSESISD